ncbi:hypothetical protein HDK90DRAFT_9472 [Phyllosticta capitalensis]|uniref:Secreted protein n=1 Tax=Phyllosticta capitalensis TaxID=121624 RepID=A0ABR1Z1V9_9PEZI
MRNYMPGVRRLLALCVPRCTLMYLANEERGWGSSAGQLDSTTREHTDWRDEGGKYLRDGGKRARCARSFRFVSSPLDDGWSGQRRYRHATLVSLEEHGAGSCPKHKRAHPRYLPTCTQDREKKRASCIEFRYLYQICCCCCRCHEPLRRPRSTNTILPHSKEIAIKPKPPSLIGRRALKGICARPSPSFLLSSNTCSLLLLYTS